MQGVVVEASNGRCCDTVDSGPAGACCTRSVGPRDKSIFFFVCVTQGAGERIRERWQEEFWFFFCVSEIMEMRPLHEWISFCLPCCHV